MRQITPVASEQVTRQFGAEPIIVVGINIAGNFIYYGDREHEHFQARINEISGLDNVINISQNAAHAAVSIQFIDVDGEFKALFDAHDLHKVPCRIYQYFPDTDFENDKILLFEGQLASPIVYDESQMTLTVSSLSKIEDIEVGFSPDNSLWAHIIPNEIEPQAWPMPFGTPINYPLVQTTQEPYGSLIHGFGIPDFTNPFARTAGLAQLSDFNRYTVYLLQGVHVSIWRLRQIAEFIERNQELINQRQMYLNRIQVSIADLLTELSDRDAPTPRQGSPEALAQQAEDELYLQLQTLRNAALALGYHGFWRPSAVIENLLRNAQYELQDTIEAYNHETQRIQAHITALQNVFNDLARKRRLWEQEAQRAQAAANEAQQRLAAELESYQLQLQYYPKTIAIWNGQRFPYDRSLWLKIGNALVRGRFTHKVYAHEGVSYFKVSEAIHPLWCDFTGEHCTELESSMLRMFPSVDYGQYISQFDPNNPRTWVEDADLPKNITSPTTIKMYEARLESQRIGRLTGDRANFHWVASGSPVRIAYSNPVEFVLTIVPCTLLRLAAYRTYVGQRHLATIPPDWYTVEQRDYGDGLIATVIVLKRPLDSLANVGFEGQLFATVTSDVGPNVVDVIRYLVEKYLPDTTCDEETFIRVKNETANWPVNFALLDRYNIIELLSTICFQACIGIWYSESTVFLRYLPNMPDEPIDITDSNIDADSLQLSYTSTEDVITKITAAYFPSYDMPGPIRLAARHNTTKYGITEQNINYLIYNDREAVVRSLTFWLIRKANTWKYMEFTTGLDTLVFETMDALSVKSDSCPFAHGPVTGIIEQVEYDSLEFTLRYRVWLPVRAGEMETYKFAYYNIGDINDEFPEPRDWATGNGLGSPILRSLRPQSWGHFKSITYEQVSKIPEIQQTAPPIMLQPKRPERRYSGEPGTESGYSTPVHPPIDGSYGDPLFPDVDFGDSEFQPGNIEDTGFLPNPIVEPLRQHAQPRASGPALSLQRTVIQDEYGGKAVLSSLIAAIIDHRLHLSTKISVCKDGGQDPGVFELLPAYEAEYGAKLAFLAEDPENVPEEES